MNSQCLRLATQLVVAFSALTAHAGQTPAAAQTVTAARLELPDAPSFSPTDAPSTAGTATAFGGQLPRVTPTVNGQRYHRIIRPGGYAPPLTAADKLKLSIISRLSVVEIASTLYSAGISQLRDSRPHYGEDGGAFAERFGAIALKHTSQAFLSYGVYAAAFREDPRYYVLGREHRIVNRAVYSATRLFVTRSDSGSSTVNWAKIAGLSSANALTNLYYPSEDRTADAFFKNEESSLFGTIVNNEIHEFIGDLKDLIFHKKQ